MLGFVHQFGNIPEPVAQAVRDLAPAGTRLAAVLLGEDGLHHGADHGLVGLADGGQQVALKGKIAGNESGPQGAALWAYSGQETAVARVAPSVLRCA